MRKKLVEREINIQNTPKYRRIDSISWLIQGDDKCGSACFADNTILFATNKVTESELIRKIKTYLNSVAKEILNFKENAPFQEEFLKRKLYELQIVINGQIQEILNYVSDNVNFYKGGIGFKKEEMKIEIKFNLSDNDSDEYQSEEDEEQTYRPYYADFNRSLEKVTYSIIDGYLKPSARGAFAQPILDAIAKNSFEFCPGRENEHAELKLIEYIFQKHEIILNKKIQKQSIQQKAFLRNIHIGVSKKCCRDCEFMIIAINKVLKKINNGFNYFSIKAVGTNYAFGKRATIPALIWNCQEICDEYRKLLSAGGGAKRRNSSKRSTSTQQIHHKSKGSKKTQTKISKNKLLALPNSNKESKLETSVSRGSKKRSKARTKKVLQECYLVFTGENVANSKSLESYLLNYTEISKHLFKTEKEAKTNLGEKSGSIIKFGMSQEEFEDSLINENCSEILEKINALPESDITFLADISKEFLQKQKRIFNFWKEIKNKNSKAEEKQNEEIKKQQEEIAERLYKIANDRGYECCNVPDDNNCQFHAIAAQLNLLKNQLKSKGWSGLATLNHEDLRKRAVGVIKRNKDQFKPFITENVDEYIDKMKKINEEWGDNLTLIALSQALKINITLLHADGSLLHFPDPFNMNALATINIGYNGYNHYWSLKPKTPAQSLDSSLTSQISTATCTNESSLASDEKKSYEAKTFSAYSIQQTFMPPPPVTASPTQLIQQTENIANQEELLESKSSQSHAYSGKEEEERKPNDNEDYAMMGPKR